MKHERTIIDDLGGDPAAEAAADARADADVRAGRLIGHETMTRWLKSWGTGKRAPAASRRLSCGLSANLGTNLGTGTNLIWGQFK